MNAKEIEQLIKDLKRQFKKGYPNKSDEEIEHMILDVFFQAFCEDKMDRRDLTTLTNALGYDVKDEILDQVEEEKKKGRK